MWVFTPGSFVSIVDKDDPSGQTLLVRARKAGDIERLFPDANVQVGGATDYDFRSRIDREVVALKIADEIRKIRFTNFKNEVKEDDRHDAYYQVWQAMYKFQKGNAGRRSA